MEQHNTIDMGLHSVVVKKVMAVYKEPHPNADMVTWEEFERMEQRAREENLQEDD